MGSIIVSTPTLNNLEIDPCADINSIIETIPLTRFEIIFSLGKLLTTFFVTISGFFQSSTIGGEELGEI
jgi:hypothetical protein